jgi:hypothetical protein
MRSTAEARKEQEETDINESLKDIKKRDDKAKAVFAKHIKTGVAIINEKNNQYNI